MSAKTPEKAAKMPSGFRKAFILIAIGTTISFLVAIIGCLYAMFEKINKDGFTVAFVTMAVGCLLMMTGYIIGAHVARRSNMKRKGFVLAAVAAGVAAILNLLFIGVVDNNHIITLKYMKCTTAMLIIVGMTVTPLMAWGWWHIHRFFTHAKSVFESFCVLSVMVVFFYIVWGICMRMNVNLWDGGYRVESHYESIEIRNISAHAGGYGYYININNKGYNEDKYLNESDLAGVSLLLMSAACFGVLVCGWLMPGAKVKRRESVAAGASASAVPEPGYVAVNEPEAVKVTDHSRYQPKPQSEPQPQAEPKQEISPEIRSRLLSLSDNELEDVINKPLMYTPEYVAEARSVLNGRRAWAQLKGMSDQQLLAVTMAPQGTYRQEVVEAAAMGLYTNSSPVLRQQFSLLTPELLKQIATGASQAPEGIRLAAAEFLSSGSQA